MFGVVLFCQVVQNGKGKLSTVADESSSWTCKLRTFVLEVIAALIYTVSLLSKIQNGGTHLVRLKAVGNPYMWVVGGILLRFWGLQHDRHECVLSFIR